VDFSAPSTDLVLVESAISVAALVLDRVERTAGGGGVLPNACFVFAFFPLGMVEGCGGVKFSFPPVISEFLHSALFWCRIKISDLPQIATHTC
jgi:hypothetical protein